MYDNRRYIIFPVTELSKVHFSLVGETSEETVRRSVDGTKTFVKWDSGKPAFVDDIVGTEGPYTHEEILTILATEEWTAPMDPMEEEMV
jgi:hypothetical protein